MLEVFFIGDPTDSHFAETLGWLRANGSLHVLSDIDNAVRRVQEGRACPAVAFLGQSRRGQFAQSDVDRLLRAAPLARVVVLLGSWCEGETRSGVPVPGVHRLYWHEARQAVPRELAALEAGRVSGWSWPAMAAPFAAPIPTKRGRGLVVVFSGSVVMAQAVCLALREAGWNTAIAQPSGAAQMILGAEAIVWDVAADSEGADAEWETLQTRFAGLPMVAICGFPRPEDVAHLRSMGVDVVVGKPFQVADLVAAVERVVAEHHADARQTVDAA